MTADRAYIKNAQPDAPPAGLPRENEVVFAWEVSLEHTGGGGGSCYNYAYNKAYSFLCINTPFEDFICDI
ncbi:MAG: hypothetical protein LBP19_03470, partial [Treponema sp.]|nr:hypothetical protein [Treponema sp.]